MKLTQRLPWPFALAARLVCYSIALAISYGLLHFYASIQLAQHMEDCHIRSTSESSLAEVKDLDACLTEKSGFLERFLFRSFHKGVAALPHAPKSFVGTWTSTQPHCTYRITLSGTSKFEAEPMACEISSQRYEGLWGVDGDTMIWINGSNGRLVLAADINPIESATPDAFTLVEQNGSRTTFTRDGSSPSAKPKDALSASVDKGAYLDVWKLRDDVAALEAIEASDDTERCYPEEGDDSDEKPTPEQSKKYESEAAACAEKIESAYATYKKARETFNAKWLPPFRNAIQHGDQVAEVIMRQCETTPVLDRHEFETTCDEDPSRRNVARKRLVEIGFLPAVDLSEEVVQDWLNPSASPRQRELNQLAVMKKLRGGALGFDRGKVDFTGNVVAKDGDMELARRWALMEAISQDAPRAFTYSPGDADGGWKTSQFTTLRLNRKPATPSYMTWGPALYFGGSNTPFTGPRYWRLATEEMYTGQQSTDKAVAIAGRGVADFESIRAQWLAEIESNINRYLAQDPRWAVFLIHRVGFHEWVPEKMASQTGEIDPSWEGNWILERESADWTKPLSPATGHAEIRRQGDRTLITITTERNEEPLWNVVDCELRYSGGSTYLPKGQDAGETLLGYFYAGGQTRASSFYKAGDNQEAVAPFDPTKRYKQVLMQCDKAEAPDAVRVRFLLLAGDTLVEFAAARPFDGPLAVRHYRRQH